MRDGKLNRAQLRKVERMVISLDALAGTLPEQGKCNDHERFTLDRLLTAAKPLIDLIDAHRSASPTPDKEGV